MYRAFTLAAAALLVLGAPAAGAQTLQRFQVKVGVSGILPDESASITPIGGTVDISDEAVPSLQVEYFFTERVSAELLCCVATHDVSAVGTSVGTVDLGEVTHFPPTLTLKYRWLELGRVEPYVGAGVNFTAFIDDEVPATGPVNAIDYDSSVGGALQVGADIRIDDRWFVNVDLRRIWISPDVSIDTALGLVEAEVDIHPWVTSFSVGYRF